MNSTYFEMNPYFNMASEAAMNAATYFNATAQNFMMNQWPILQERMDILWANFQRQDPKMLIGLYPLVLLTLAMVIWTKNPGAPQYKKDVDDMEDIEEESPEDLFSNNMFSRNRRVLLVTPMKREDDHPMIRRSQATRVYVRFN